MELTAVNVLLIVFQVLVGVVMLLVKFSLDKTQHEIKSLQERQQYIADNYVKREELKEIKQDFSERFDRFERNIKEWITKS